MSTTRNLLSENNDGEEEDEEEEEEEDDRMIAMHSERKLSKYEPDLSYLDLVPSRSRSGAYLWEKDNWAGSVINTCKLMEELTGNSHGPVMDNHIKGCPVKTCMSYGTKTIQ
jgi:hypothetical protein